MSIQRHFAPISGRFDRNIHYIKPKLKKQEEEAYSKSFVIA